MKRGRKPDHCLTWLCFHMACVVTDETAEFLPQHKQLGRSIGAYAMVGERLGLSPEAVEYHCRRARKRRETEEGLQEYAQWLTQRERKWWLYHTGGVETHLIHEPMSQLDYQAWLAAYERSGRFKPLLYRPLEPCHPTAIAIDERRAASGLRNGLTKRGRPRKRL